MGIMVMPFAAIKLRKAMKQAQGPGPYLAKNIGGGGVEKIKIVDI